MKIVVSSDPQARDRIIRATNNQSPVEIAALHATDKIQRDIEAILERHDWYYERRKNYRNIGKPQNRFVTPLLLASAVVSLVFKNASQATRLRARFMRTQQGYDSVFSDALPIELWPALVGVYKSVDAGLSSIPAARRRGERFINTWRPLVALLVVARRFKTFDYRTQQLLDIDSEGQIKKDEVEEMWNVIMRVDSDFGLKKKIKPVVVHACCKEAAQSFGLTGLETVGRRWIKSTQPTDLADVAQPAEFLEQVDTLLPAQPWKPGVHIAIATKLGRKPSEVGAAIQQLIAEGKRLVQRDGVVYDSDGRILATDPDRASTEDKPAA